MILSPLNSTLKSPGVRFPWGVSRVTNQLCLSVMFIGGHTLVSLASCKHESSLWCLGHVRNVAWDF